MLSIKLEGPTVQTEEITFERNEYRIKGGEIHRRPMVREHLTPVQASWLVLRREQVPHRVLEHFTQAQNRAAVN